jgi:hypothetical protein
MMGMIALVVLLLLMLGGIAVKPRTRAVRYSITGVLATLMVVLVVAMLLGFVPWGWDAPSRPAIH